MPVMGFQKKLNRTRSWWVGWALFNFWGISGICFTLQSPLVCFINCQNPEAECIRSQALSVEGNILDSLQALRESSQKCLSWNVEKCLMLANYNLYQFWDDPWRGTTTGGKSQFQEERFSIYIPGARNRVIMVTIKSVVDPSACLPPTHPPPPIGRCMLVLPSPVSASKPIGPQEECHCLLYNSCSSEVLSVGRGSSVVRAQNWQQRGPGFESL